MDSIEVKFDKAKRIIFRVGDTETCITEKSVISKVDGVALKQVKSSDINSDVSNQIKKDEADIKSNKIYDDKSKEQMLLKIKSEEHKKKVTIEVTNRLVSDKKIAIGKQIFQEILDNIKTDCEKYLSLCNNIDKRN